MSEQGWITIVSLVCAMVVCCFLIVGVVEVVLGQRKDGG
jgi:hypothetical protein